MSWINQLYETYELCADNPEFIDSDNPLLPICHTYQNAHIEIIISNTGQFLRAKVLSKGKLSTIIPCTEASGGRSGSKPVNHPLCDKLQYLAGDYLTFGGTVTTGFKKNPEEPHNNYLEQLTAWLESPYSHPKIEAISTYIHKNQLISDLVKEKILILNEESKLLSKWNGEKEDTPDIYKIMPTGQSPEGALVRWKVEKQGESLSATWEDHSLIEAWINYYTTRDATKGLCMASGKEATLAEQHPSGLRHGADKAKLISANDKVGYTFRGRFTDKNGSQACTISSEITQKAHNTLRWLIQREQAYRYGDQVFVAWVKTAKDIPDPFSNTNQLFGMDIEIIENTPAIGDIGQAFAKRLAKQVAGYHSILGSTEQVMIMGLDSATPGRMAITYYRELTGSDFLERIQRWHENVSWYQNYSKDKKFIGAPSPKDIAEAAYGRRIDDKLRKSTVERLLPCIIDGIAIPNDLIRSLFHRVCNRSSFKEKESWEWEKILGITCALIKGSSTDRNYQMALETELTDRSYLFGRLLAVADFIEEKSLWLAGENRVTNAARLMQQFSRTPDQTWQIIYLGLRQAYMPRLKARRPEQLHDLEELIGDIKNKFTKDTFIADKPLSSVFLLAYYSQRKAIQDKYKKNHTSEV